MAAVALAVVMLPGCLGVTARPAAPTAIARLLGPLGIRVDELGIRDVDTATDPWRLAIVEHLLGHPLEAVGVARGLADGFRHQRRSLAGSLALAAGVLDLSVGSIPPAVDGEPPTAARALWRLRSDGALAPASPAQLEEDLRAVPLDVQGVIADLVTAMAEAAPVLREASARLSADDRAFLLDAAHAVDRLGSPFDESRLWRFVGLARAFDRERLLAGALRIAEAMDRALQVLRGWRGPVTPRQAPPAWREAADGDVLLVVDTVLGLVVVGGPGPTTYRADAALILDLGGNDTYLNRAGGARGPEHAIALVIDVGGDDRYVASGDVAQGAGAFGVGILADLGGRDVYEARDFAQGAGVFGIGILFDESGDDRYEAGAWGQGAGGFGLGLLVDESGDDRFTARLFAQGFGASGGLGLLLDGAGDDVRRLAGGPPDPRRADHTQSFGQGFALGLRPLASGGIGLLVDMAGADRYEAGHFAQGAGYWYGVGMLVDDGGNDEYIATRYVQGAGVHFAVGVLFDGGGNDRYTSWGVSQGIGHDFAVGVLADAAGRDRYRCQTLCQGVGNADGLGLLVDLEGDDEYIADAQDAQGYGVAARRSQSLGFLIDLGGRDAYSRGGRDDARWDGGEHGGGLDGDGQHVALGFTLAPMPPSSVLRRVRRTDGSQPRYLPPADPSFSVRGAADDAVRRLLVQAADPDETSAGAARRDAAREALRGLGLEAVPALVRALEILDVSVVIEAMETLVALGAPAQEALLARLEQPYWLVRRRVSAVLGRRPGERTARALREIGLRDPDPVVRAAAAEGIGLARLAGAGDLLAHVLATDASTTARHGAVRGLRHLADRAEVEPTLLRALADRAFPVRLAARQALRELRGRAETGATLGGR